MEQYNRCLGCMEVKGEAQKCPNCGWIEGAMDEFPLCLPPGTILNDKYLIGRVLGQGGYGITYLALDTNLNQKLAIKEYFPQDMASRTSGQSKLSAHSGSMGRQYEHGMDKFLQEARTLARFNEHPNIVLVRDYFKANGTAYFVMSYVEGITLKEYLERSGGKLPLNKALRAIVPVLNALKEVHAVDVLHRDISPDNIYINRKGRVILLDFGASRQTIGEKGRTLSIILKPDYAPEEQYRTRGVQGPWTDIYAVGATFYHLITGKKPPEALERLVRDKLIPPRQQGVEITEKMEKALIKAMAVTAKDRYQTVPEFMADLLGGEPVAVPAGIKTEQKPSYSEQRQDLYRSVDSTLNDPLRSTHDQGSAEEMAIPAARYESREASVPPAPGADMDREAAAFTEYVNQGHYRRSRDFSGGDNKQSIILAIIVIFAAIILLITTSQIFFRTSWGSDIGELVVSDSRLTASSYKSSHAYISTFPGDDIFNVSSSNF